MQRGGAVLALLAIAGCNELPTDPWDVVPLAECIRGEALDYECEGIDLVALLSLDELGVVHDFGVIARLNDVWGWTDPSTGVEWVLVGHTLGIAFVSLEDPAAPQVVAQLDKTEGTIGSIWRDVKVYRDHAFVVADQVGEHGLQILDLTTLRSVRDPPAYLAPTAHYDRVASAHNIAINEETGFAYVVGANGGGETCGGGLHMIDIGEPLRPRFAGCFFDPSTGWNRTGYTHDVICVVYRGPDARYTGREVCLGSNENALSIADVSDKSAPRSIAVARYPRASYAHQAWLDEGHEYLYMNDELDETNHDALTRTLVWDVRELDDPVVAAEFTGPTHATDHNLHVRGDLMYQSNYEAGLRIVDIARRESPREVAFFDTEPGPTDFPNFNGAWSNYPFFASRVIPVTSTDGGLFLLRQRR